MTTIKITVSLDKKNDPQVVLSTRDEKAAKDDTIEWSKEDISQPFAFTLLEPTGNGEAFSKASPSQDGTRFVSKFTPTKTDPDTEYPYTLTVCEEGKHYDTTKKVPSPTGSRPVIRN